MLLYNSLIKAASPILLHLLPSNNPAADDRRVLEGSQRVSDLLMQAGPLFRALYVRGNTFALNLRGGQGRAAKSGPRGYLLLVVVLAELLPVGVCVLFTCLSVSPEWSIANFAPLADPSVIMLGPLHRAHPPV